MAIRKIFFRVRMVRQWHRLLREVASSLEALKVRLDRAWSSLVYVKDPWQGLGTSDL